MPPRPAQDVSTPPPPKKRRISQKGLPDDDDLELAAETPDSQRRSFTSDAAAMPPPSTPLTPLKRQRCEDEQREDLEANAEDDGDSDEGRSNYTFGGTKVKRCKLCPALHTDNTPLVCKESQRHNIVV